MRCSIPLLFGIYRQWLRLYPSSFRAAFAEEMEATFRQRLEECIVKNPLCAITLFLAEGRDLPVNLFKAYHHQYAKNYLAHSAIEGISAINTGGGTMRKVFGMVRIATMGVWVAIAICFIVVVYQSLLVSCRPACASVDLQGALLYRPYLRVDPEFGFSMGLGGVDFRNAVLDRIDLRGGRLRRANLSGATLTDATLRHADFAWGQLRETDLRGADLFRANLYDVDLRSAILDNADLRQAYLVETDLRGADLTNVNLAGAQYSQLTKWPEGFDPQAAGAILQYTCESRPFCR